MPSAAAAEDAADAAVAAAEFADFTSIDDPGNTAAAAAAAAAAGAVAHPSVTRSIAVTTWAMAVMTLNKACRIPAISMVSDSESQASQVTSKAGGNGKHH